MGRLAARRRLTAVRRLTAKRCLSSRAAALALSALLAGCGARAPSPPEPAPAATVLPSIDAGTSLLVVAPHPDDETLCCAGLIQRVLRAGGQASVVWITSGDAERLDLLLSDKVLLPDARAQLGLGRTRMQEARAAATLLGVPSAAQLFLGYPDGGLPTLLSEHRTTPYTSPATHAQAVPYPDALFPGHPYTGESLERDFAAVLERVRPTLMLAPSLLDQHPDHRAAGLLAIGVSARVGARWTLRYWIVHGGEGWPSPRGLLPGVPLTAAPAGQAMVPGAFTLAPAEEDRKLLALRAHETQMRAIGPFLLSFVRTTELYYGAPRPLP
jgi:LmbE family N-acetylglucosaminyl deacetylase